MVTVIDLSWILGVSITVAMVITCECQHSLRERFLLSTRFTYIFPFSCQLSHDLRCCFTCIFVGMR
ncbi:hypothetical protein NC653_006931 [Populus alba x Populus x berolinensis]|uniref:Uncharacterized protein n=1 Tax=Populus alba x Populus x berolinensis TaxID=444605 RepID=A0AAD6RFX6_9ROSI|nr:hypothetical protein NC653_006931 [Populus alba x Populus x berolinensis]